MPVEKEVDPVKVREKKNRERHDVEYSLARLHKRVRGETAWQNQPTDYQSLYDPKPDGTYYSIIIHMTHSINYQYFRK